MPNQSPSVQKLLNVLPILRCPDDKGEFEFVEESQEGPLEGRLKCKQCGRSFDYAGGIAFLMPRSADEYLRKEVKEFYEKFGWEKRDGRYEDAIRFTASAAFLTPKHQNFAAYLSSKMNPRGEFFLDAGCGANPNVNLGGGYRYHICVDFAAAALKECQKKLGDRGFFILGDAVNLPVASDSMGAVLCSHCVYHIDAAQQGDALRELYRVAAEGAKGGILYASPYSPGYILSLHWLEFYCAPLHRILCALRDSVKRIFHPNEKPPLFTLYFRPLSPRYIHKQLAGKPHHIELLALCSDQTLEAFLKFLPFRRQWLRCFIALENSIRTKAAWIGHHVAYYFEKPRA